MAIESSSKNAGVAVFYIAIEAGSNIARALRGFLTAVKYANVKYGEKYYMDYLKGEKGHKFRSELDFIRVTNEVKKSDIERIPVTAKDKYIIEEMTHNMNIDYSLIRRPEDLENMIEKNFVRKEELSGVEKKIVRAFTIRDSNGNVVMDPERPGFPVINNAEYMLTIASTDLEKWEIITRELERLSHKPTLYDRLTNAKWMNIIRKVAGKNKEEPQHEQPQREDSEQTRDDVNIERNLHKDIARDNPNEMIKKLVTYLVPKVRSYEELKAVMEKMGFEIDNGENYIVTAARKLIDGNIIVEADSKQYYKVRIPRSKKYEEKKTYVYVPKEFLEWNDNQTSAVLSLPFDARLRTEDEDGHIGSITIDENFLLYWDDKSKTIMDITLPDSVEVLDGNRLKTFDGVPINKVTLSEYIKKYNRENTAHIIDLIMDSQDSKELQQNISSLFEKANIRFDTPSFIERTPLMYYTPAEGIEKITNFILPRVKSYDDFIRVMMEVGFAVEQSEGTLKIKTPYSEQWYSINDIRGLDGTCYSLEKIQEFIIENDRNNNLELISALIRDDTAVVSEDSVGVVDKSKFKNELFKEAGIVAKEKSRQRTEERTNKNTHEKKRERTDKAPSKGDAR